MAIQVKMAKAAAAATTTPTSAAQLPKQRRTPRLLSKDETFVLAALAPTKDQNKYRSLCDELLAILSTSTTVLERRNQLKFSPN